MPDNQIVITGAGNVATNLAFAFHKNITKNIHIHSRTEQSAKRLAEKINGSFSFDVNNIPANAALYFLSVNDDAISDLVNNRIFKEKIKNNLVVHAAGSVPASILKTLSSNYGVFYPLQTFSKTNILDFKNIPICIEASSGFYYNVLNKYASQISEDVRNISSEQRKYIHLAAVFANNFSNRIFGIAEEILSDQNIDFDILYPLIEETFNKIKHSKPTQIQTGPAARNDIKVMEMQLEMLKNKPDLQKIYSFVSKNIQSLKK